MKIFKNLNIKKKLFILIITVFFFTILSVVIYTIISVTHTTDKKAVEITEIINDNYTVKIEAELNRGVELLNFIFEIIQNKTESGRLQLNKTEINLLKSFLESNKDITHLFLLMDENFISENLQTNSNNDDVQSYSLSFYNSNNEVIPTVSETGRYTFDLMKLNYREYEQYTYMSEPFNLNLLETDETVLTIAKPIYKHNKVIGAVGINFSLSEVAEIINSIIYYEYGVDAELVLLTENNNIVFITEKPWLSGKNILNSNTKEQEIYNSLKLNENNIKGGKYKAVVNSFNAEETNVSWELITILPTITLTQKLMSDIYKALLIVSLILVLGLFTVLFFIKKTFNPINSLVKVVKKLSRGELIELSENNNYNNEFDKIAVGLNKVSENIKEAADISYNIANGNYNEKVKQKGEDDILSVSINKIAQNLKTAEEENLLQKKTTYKQLWMRKGRFEVSEAERKSENNIKDLTFNILQELVNYTNAVIGGIYLYDPDSQIITLTASYAYENRKQINKTFKVGEGIVGACVIEKKKIILNKVPYDYIKIASGLGNGIPSNISVIPVFYQEKINAVIELAFLKQPEEYVIEFIEQLSDNIGAWIDASLINTKTAELLLISRKQTKELANKEKELETKVEELQRIQAEIDMQNAESKSIMNAINHTVLTVEYTLDGVVVNSNEKYEEIMGFSPEDIIGANVFDIVKDQKEDLGLIILQVAKGIPVKTQVKRYTKSGKEKWLSATYTPYYNTEGKITRVLFFAHDITKMKTELDKLKASG
ncbi:MAG: PAS domain S-box protein [Bacteroidales bacterium]|nr:PAS domain S-box protein [Bacteroidales bacterium]